MAFRVAKCLGTDLRNSALPAISLILSSSFFPSGPPADAPAASRRQQVHGNRRPKRRGAGMVDMNVGPRDEETDRSLALLTPRGSANASAKRGVPVAQAARL